jgi:hypothetical protein
MRLLRFCAFGAVLGAAGGCGSRTGLLVPDEPPEEPAEAGVDASDATAPEDAAPDATAPDAPFDSGPDAPADVTLDAVRDALPPLDVGKSIPIGCEEAGVDGTLIYLVTAQNDLWSFYPPSLAFRLIGHINCPDPGSPFSMAVDQTGIAYVLYDDGHLFRVRTADAFCQPTPFTVGQEGFVTFGMGYSQNPSGVGETLYIASDQIEAGAPSQLGLIDTTQFAVHAIGLFPPQVASAELTGTGAGDLFAFYALNPTPNAKTGSAAPSAIGQIDKANGGLLGETILPNVAQGCGWAFAFWGGDFYTFTAPPAPETVCGAMTLSVVWRYRPADGSQNEIAKFGEEIVGAGVSTCAPQE